MIDKVFRILFFCILVTLVFAIHVGTVFSDPSTLDWDHAWNSLDPYPKFITTSYLDLSNMVEISKFRSGVGHDFTDEYEDPGRSMKHYYLPLPQYREGFGTAHDLKMFSPISGTIADIQKEEHILSNGDFQSYQLQIIPDGYKMFEVRLFHVNYLNTLAIGSHVSAGDWIG
jgi:hypothetical protein